MDDGVVWDERENDGDGNGSDQETPLEAGNDQNIFGTYLADLKIKHKLTQVFK